MKKITMGFLLVLLVFTLNGCDTSERDQRFTVVATTTYIGDMINMIGGDYVHVETLMAPGVDPHDYEPRQSDTERLINADMIVANGLNLEERMVDVLREFSGDKMLVLGEHVPEHQLLHEDNDVVDPHIWFNLDIWSELVMVAAEAMGALDEDHADIFIARATAYQHDLRMLDAYIKSQIERLPTDKRILVTAHDAFAYFGEAYGFEVHAIQGISTESEASIRDIDQLAQLLVQQNIQSVFFESSVPQTTVNALVESARSLNHDVNIGGELYSDSTGPISKGHETLLRTYRVNIDVIVSALLEE